MAQVEDTIRHLAASIDPRYAPVFDAIIDAINDLADGAIDTTTVVTTGDITVGDDINLEGATGTHDVVLKDNVADALSFVVAGGGNDLIVLDTRDSAERVLIGRVAGQKTLIGNASIGVSSDAPSTSHLLQIGGTGASVTALSDGHANLMWSNAGTITSGNFDNEELAVWMQVASTIQVQGATPTYACGLVIESPAIETVSGTPVITNVAGLYIDGAPTVAGGATVTNGPYAIHVNDGESRFDGGIRGPTVASARCWHTGGNPAMVSTDGTNLTVVVTELYVAEVFIPANATITGVAVFWGDATEGNAKVMLFNSAGTRVAISASTDVSGFTVDSYGTRIPFTSAYSAVGPGTYYVGVIADNTANRINTHTLGNFGAGKITGLVYATEAGYATITPPTTFTTGLGPIATLY